MTRRFLVFGCVVRICTTFPKCRLCDVCVLSLLSEAAVHLPLSATVLYIISNCFVTKMGRELTVKSCHLGSKVIFSRTECLMHESFYYQLNFITIFYLQVKIRRLKQWSHVKRICYIAGFIYYGSEDAVCEHDMNVVAVEINI